MKLFVSICLLFLLLPVHILSAQESTSVSQAEVSPDPIQYYLPYPGLLPGSPLYFLKASRDSIIGFLIVSPPKKAEFDLLQADKSLQEASFLVKEKRDYLPLAVESLKKSNTYLVDAVKKTQEAARQKYVMRDFASRLLLSIKKHREVLGGFDTQFPKEKSTYRLLDQTLASLEKSVNSLVKQ